MSLLSPHSGAGCGSQAGSQMRSLKKTRKSKTAQNKTQIAGFTPESSKKYFLHMKGFVLLLGP